MFFCAEQALRLDHLIKNDFLIFNVSSLPILTLSAPENGKLNEKIDALKKVILLTLQGEKFPTLLMVRVAHTLMKPYLSNTYADHHPLRDARG